MCIWIYEKNILHSIVGRSSMNTSLLHFNLGFQIKWIWQTLTRSTGKVQSCVLQCATPEKKTTHKHTNTQEESWDACVKRKRANKHLLWILGSYTIRTQLGKFVECCVCVFRKKGRKNNMLKTSLDQVPIKFPFNRFAKSFIVCFAYSFAALFMSYFYLLVEISACSLSLQFY